MAIKRRSPSRQVFCEPVRSAGPACCVELFALAMACELTFRLSGYSRTNVDFVAMASIFQGHRMSMLEFPQLVRPNFSQRRDKVYSPAAAAKQLKAIYDLGGRVEQQCR